jgi:serine/threonine protein phosphatase 1
MLIIGDIAGQYVSLMKLIAKCPKVDLILAVGDLCDRGPDSARVIEYFMKTPNAEALMGNHDAMMWESCGGTDANSSRDVMDCWLHNGGGYTLKSYATLENPDAFDVPAEVVEWLGKRPLYWEDEELFVSHAPITSLKNIPKDRFSREWKHIGIDDYSFIWNRMMPRKPQDKFMVHGHNWQMREYKGGDGKVFGMCIDSSSKQELVALHWQGKDNYKIYTEPYAEEKEF